MPRAFTESERVRVGQDLRRAARREFAREGYRGATIERIASSAGVGKGTFYLFHESKAAAFVAVAREIETEMRAELLLELNRPFESARARLEHLFRALLRGLEGHPTLWILLDPAEAPALFRDLTPEMRAELSRADDAFFEALVANWTDSGWMRPTDPEVVAGLGRALFAVGLHRDMVGGAYDAVADALVTAVARELEPG